tara:strand:+ start:152 stop:346 length:195 start_codon:yes stop_codon:yes gene_type:complete
MSLLNEDLIEKILLITWRNPAFMAISIALIWLIPQLIIRKVLENNYQKKKLIKQKKKIDSLYPK